MNNDTLKIDFKRVFESSPDCFLLLDIDSPRFTILAASDAYTVATNTKREHILGKGLFEVFPDNPDDPNSTGVTNLTASLLRAIEHKKTDVMPTQKYDIPRSEDPDAPFEERFWSPDNTPVTDASGNVVYIIHHVTDVTQHERLVKTYGAMEHQLQSTTTANVELERLNKAMVGRELKMAELKKENEELKKKLSQ